jgi:hypothetical protein
MIPLTIWIVDNSSSMLMTDGKRLVETTSQQDVRLASCSRWQELHETVQYHAQLAALLEAPTKFILLNKPSAGGGSCPQEMTIAERGSDFIQEDLEQFLEAFSTVQPLGMTPLTLHLKRIYQSIQHLENRIVLVLATDGRPTDEFGYSSAQVDQEFEQALRQLQNKAWIVIRLCTNDDRILQYYQKLDDQLELSLEVLDDYLDEAKEVHGYNPWLTYSLCLHRCREMGMSCHGLYRWLDLLDERMLTRAEISDALQVLGLAPRDANGFFLGTDDWDEFCRGVQEQQQQQQQQQQSLQQQRPNESLRPSTEFLPWNPITKKPKPWIDLRSLQRHGQKSSCSWIGVVVVLMLAIMVHFVLRDA